MLDGVAVSFYAFGDHWICIIVLGTVLEFQS